MAILVQGLSNKTLAWDRGIGRLVVTQVEIRDTTMEICLIRCSSTINNTIWDPRELKELILTIQLSNLCLELVPEEQQERLGQAIKLPKGETDEDTGNKTSNQAAEQMIGTLQGDKTDPTDKADKMLKMLAEEDSTVEILSHTKIKPSMWELITEEDLKEHLTGADSRTTNSNNLNKLLTIEKAHRTSALNSRTKW